MIRWTVAVYCHQHSACSCRRAHRAATFALQPALSLARCSAWCQESHLISPLSLQAVLHHVSQGRPLQRFPSGVRVGICIHTKNIPYPCPSLLFDLFVDLWNMWSFLDRFLKLHLANRFVVFFSLLSKLRIFINSLTISWSGTHNRVRLQIKCALGGGDCLQHWH